jgi:DNA-binding MarR family transcriptional regulator
MTEGKTAVVTTISPAYHPDTGEHVADVHIDKIVKTGRRKAKLQKGGFVMLSKVGLRKIELTSAQWSIFAQLLAFMDHTTGESRVSTSELAEITGMVAPNVSRALREMQDRKLLLKLGVSRYRINSHIAHLAGADEEIRDSDPEPEWSRS